MAAGVQDFNRTEFDRLNEIKGHLEIALLEKHFLREGGGGGGAAGRGHSLAGVQPGHTGVTVGAARLAVGTGVAPRGRPHTALAS